MNDDVPGAATRAGIVTASVLPPGPGYPGAEHRYWVHRRPGGGSGPLPVVVVLDGGWLHLAEAPADSPLLSVLDRLTAAGEIPEAVTVLVDPPVSLPTSDRQQARWERSFQYDALSDRFAGFLVDELLPAVAAEHPISDRPEDCLVVGISSSAVAALVAAWHRPDRIGRVLTSIGTYVGMRGADTLAVIVRKSEPKPLRVWLHTNREDHVSADQPWGTHYAGSWPIANRTLADALRFAGYDSVLVETGGGHDLDNTGRLLPDALRWIWSDRLADGTVPPLPVHRPAEEGTPGWDASGSVWSTIVEADDWQVVDVDGPLDGLSVRADGTPVTSAGPGITAFTCGRDDDLFVVTARGDLRLRRAGRETVVLERFPATALLWSGDGVLHGVVGDHLETVDLATRAVTRSELGLRRPSALGLSSDRAQLLVTDGSSRHQWSFLRDGNGIPTAPEPFFRMEELDDDGGATAVTTDTGGWTYFATPLGIQVAEPIGRVAKILHKPSPIGEVVALALSGHDLYAVQSGVLHRRTVRSTGSSPQIPVTPPRPQL